MSKNPSSAIHKLSTVLPSAVVVSASELSRIADAIKLMAAPKEEPFFSNIPAFLVYFNGLSDAT